MYMYNVIFELTVLYTDILDNLEFKSNGSMYEMELNFKILTFTV